MSLANLTSVSNGASLQGITVSNPPMTYDVTLGTPAAQGIVPPFTNLPAHIFELNGAGYGYNWNNQTAAWKQI